VTALAQLVTDRLFVEQEPSTVRALVRLLAGGLLSGAGAPELRERATLAAFNRLTKESDNLYNIDLIVSLKQLAEQNGRAEASLLAHYLVSYVKKSQPDSTRLLPRIYYLMSLFPFVADCMEAAEAAALTQVAVERLAGGLPGNGYDEPFAGIVAVLSPRLEPGMAGRLAGILVKTLSDRGEYVPPRALALASLAARLRPPEGAAVVGPAVDKLVDRLVSSSLGLDSGDLTYQGVVHLAPRLGAAEARDPAQRLVDWMARAGEREILYRGVMVAASLSALAARLGRSEAEGLVAPFVKRLAGRLTRETNVWGFNSIADGIAALVPRLGEAELLDVLKQYGSIHVIRTAALDELGRRAVRPPAVEMLAVGGAGAVAVGPQPFRTVWEFVAWAEQHRPDLDLKAPPKPSPEPTVTAPQ
jgi:hypothetical protein